MRSYILNGELTEEESLKIEAQLISVLTHFQGFELANLVKGHHEYGIVDTRAVDSKYTDLVDIEKMAKKYDVPVFGVKVTDDWYKKTQWGDSRSVLEGRWTANPDEVNKCQVVIGVSNGVVFGVYELIPGSAKRQTDVFKNQDEYNSWYELQSWRAGTTEIHYSFADGKDRTIFSLKPIIPPHTNKLVAKYEIDEKSNIYKFAKNVINRRVIEDQFSGQNPIKYFNKKSAK